MSTSSATGFPDTVVLPESTFTGPSAAADGKPAPRGGKDLPPARPEAASIDRAEAARALERLSRSIGRELRFEVDLDGGDTVIYVLDRDTGELIRRIPGSELTRLAASDGRITSGLLDDLL